MLFLGVSKISIPETPFFTSDFRVRTPVRLDTDSTTEVTVVEGQRASLDCVAAGFPSPRIDWTRKDGAVMFNGKQEFTGSSLV